jgi:hypothetical protein
MADGDEYDESVAVGLNGDEDEAGAIFILFGGENNDTPLR